jgi:glycosyltransferase involved in cell wall biosynthesis
MAEADLEARRWLERFARRHGRPLRVLHIGNIANNAYNNARIQRSRGIDADVISYGADHVTSTPEWEDANVTGPVDPWLPDWWAVGLGDWRRPPWFVQGPMFMCLCYLRSRHTRRQGDANRVRASLIADYWQKVADADARTGVSRAGGPFDDQALATSRALGYVAVGEAGARARLVEWAAAAGSPDALLRHKVRLLTDVVAPAVRRALDGERLSPVDRMILALNRRVRGRRGPASLPRHEAVAGTPSSGRTRAALASAWGLLLFALTRPFATLGEPRPEPSTAVLDGRFERLHREHLPAARERDVADDVAAARRLAAAPWAEVLAHYDIVQGYSTDGVIPLYHGLENFTAYEHGTIRAIPFEDDTQGRLCNLTYRCAPRVFVTNTDVLPSVARLQIPAERVVRLPHALDDEKLRAFRDGHPHLEPPAGPPVFLSPTRHHWARGTLSWLKGNDVFLRAAARLAEAGCAFSIVLVEWGAEVDDSKALIAELGLSARVRWVPMMSKKSLWTAYCRAHAVVDQFAIPALGGVGMEALALGRRLITRLDEPTLAGFFGACPPVLNAATQDEVERAMRRVLDDPQDRDGLGAAGRGWIETYHSAARIVALQVRAYREIVERVADAAGG